MSTSTAISNQDQQRLNQQQAFNDSHQKELDLLSILHGGKSPTKTDRNTSSLRNPEPIPSVGGGGFSMQQFGDLAVPKPSALPAAPKVFDCAALESELIRNKSSNDLNLASAKFNEFSTGSNVDMREIKSSPNLRQLDDVERESRQLPGMLNLNQTPKGERVTFNRHAHSVPAQGTNMMSPNVVMGASTTLASKDQQKIAIAGLSLIIFHYFQTFHKGRLGQRIQSYKYLYLFFAKNRH